MAILCFSSIAVQAHSGRTNGDGCHNETSTGSYHCHNSVVPTTPTPVIITAPTISYSWNTGAWSSCSGECGEGNGVKFREVYCKSSLGSFSSSYNCSGSEPLSVSDCTESICAIELVEPEAVYYPTPNRINDVLNNDISKITSNYFDDRAELSCVHTFQGFYSIDLIANSLGFGINVLNNPSACESYSGKFSFLTNILTIFSINVGESNFRASLELDNSGIFNLIYVQDNSIETPSLPTLYNRDDWGRWKDFDNDCQDTRSEVLAEFNQIDGYSCTASLGEWLDPYTNIIFTDAGDMDIDHIVPVSYAHNHGGYGWSDELKEQFYNDQENLLAVDASANRSKGNKSPAEWMPDNADYHCIYVDNFLYIVDKYHLDISDSERATINSRCDN